MIATLDQQLIGRYFEMLKCHPELPAFTSPLGQPMMSREAVEWALDGQLTHIMYVKDGKIYVGWVDSAGLKWFFDAYAV